MKNKFNLKSLIVFKLMDLLLIYILLPIFSFFLLKFLPGSPFDNDFAISPLIRSGIEKSWHLSKGAEIQFFYYMKSFLSFDFGYSLVRPGQAVGDLIIHNIRESFVLLSLSVAMAYFFGVLYSVSAISPKMRKWESKFDTIAKILTSLPTLILAPLLIYIFSYKLSLFPIAFLSDAHSYLLPSFALSLRASAIIYRYLKPELKNNMSSEFIRYGRAKGLSSEYLIFHHALPISFAIVLSFTPSLIIGVVSGAFLVENIFAIPGVASEFVHALQMRDYPVMSGLFFCFAIGFYTLTSLCEILKVRLDPRSLESGM